MLTIAVAKAFACSLPNKQRTNKEPSFRPKLLTPSVSSAAEKSASRPALPQTNSFHLVYDRRNLFFAFSAQKSHVKP